MGRIDRLIDVADQRLAGVRLDDIDLVEIEVSRPGNTVRPGFENEAAIGLGHQAISVVAWRATFFMTVGRA